MTIRWKRGFFRAWVVFAVLWIAGSALIIRLFEPTIHDPIAELAGEWHILLPDLPPPIRTRSGCEEMAKWAAEEFPTFKYDLEACVQMAYEKNWSDAGKVMWMFLPPVLILMFGSAVAWTIQGFRP